MLWLALSAIAATQTFKPADIAHWLWISPKPGPTLRLAPDHSAVEIHVPQRKNGYDLWEWRDANIAPRLFFKIPDRNFTFTARLQLPDIPPDASFHMAAVVAFSPRCLIAWGPFRNCLEGMERPELWLEPTGCARLATAPWPNPSAPIDLRITRTGDCYEFYFRDGSTWRKVGEAWGFAKPAFVGFLAKTFGAGKPMTLRILSASLQLSDADLPDFFECSVTVDLSGPSWPLSDWRFGHFIEHMLDCIQGGLWAELLYNRKFTGRADKSGVVEAWTALYKDGASYRPDNKIYYAPAQSQFMQAAARKKAGIAQGRIALPARVAFTGRIVARADRPIRLTVGLRDGRGPVCSATIGPVTSDWTKLPFTLPALEKPADLSFFIQFTGPGRVWLGAASLMPADNISGFRREVIKALREVGAPIIRWPGGNFASQYDWRDGIGDRDRRPPRWNRAWNHWEFNDVGTDEFLELCRLLGAEPYICANAGELGAREAAEWVRYCRLRVSQLRAGAGPLPWAPPESPASLAPGLSLALPFLRDPSTISPPAAAAKRASPAHSTTASAPSSDRRPHGPLPALDGNPSPNAPAPGTGHLAPTAQPPQPSAAASDGGPGEPGTPPATAAGSSAGRPATPLPHAPSAQTPQPAPSPATATRPGESQSAVCMSNSLPHRAPSKQASLAAKDHSTMEASNLHARLTLPHPCGDSSAGSPRTATGEAVTAQAADPPHRSLASPTAPNAAGREAEGARGANPPLCSPASPGGSEIPKEFLVMAHDTHPPRLSCASAASPQIPNPLLVMAGDAHVPRISPARPASPQIPRARIVMAHATRVPHLPSASPASLPITNARVVMTHDTHLPGAYPAPLASPQIPKARLVLTQDTRLPRDCAAQPSARSVRGFRDVIVWGLGNEMYGPWQHGHLSPERYAIKAVEMANAMRAVDPRLKFVTVGVMERQFGDWNSRVLPIAAHVTDWLSAHYYIDVCMDDALLGLSQCLGGAVELERQLRNTWEIARRAAGRPIPLALDEWSVTRPRSDEPGWKGFYSLREAMFAAGVYNALNRLGPICPLACETQAVNVLGLIRVNSRQVVLTPDWFVMKIFRDHGGERGLKVAYRGPKVTVARAGTVPAVDVSCTYVSKTLSPAAREGIASSAAPDLSALGNNNYGIATVTSVMQYAPKPHLPGQGPGNNPLGATLSIGQSGCELGLLGEGAIDNSITGIVCAGGGGEWRLPGGGASRAHLTPTTSADSGADKGQPARPRAHSNRLAGAISARDGRWEESVEGVGLDSDRLAPISSATDEGGASAPKPAAEHRECATGAWEVASQKGRVVMSSPTSRRCDADAARPAGCGQRRGWCLGREKASTGGVRLASAAVCDVPVAAAEGRRSDPPGAGSAGAAARAVQGRAPERAAIAGRADLLLAGEDGHGALGAGRVNLSPAGGHVRCAARAVQGRGDLLAGSRPAVRAGGAQLLPAGSDGHGRVAVRRVNVLLVNRHADRAAVVRVYVRGLEGRKVERVRVTRLWHEDLLAANDWGSPRRVVARSWLVAPRLPLRIELPPHSLTAIAIFLADDR